MLARWCSYAALVATALVLAVPGTAGAAFSAEPSPNAFGGENLLNGVSGSSPSDVWAVGSLCCSGRNFGRGTLTEHWNGSAWTIVPSPDVRLFDDRLNGVAALSPVNAWAVGDIKQSGYRSGNPLIVHWDGSSWRTAPPPSGLTGGLRAVSADSAGDLWAVGDDGHGQGVALRLVGGTWVRVPVPHVSSDRLRGVKVFGPNDAWAVGDSGGSTLVLHWNGAAWSVVPSPNPDGYSNILNAVDGVSGSDLWAVGQKGQNKSNTGVPPGTRTLALHWNGRTFSEIAPPNIGDQDSLSGVKAVASAAVTVVGTYQDTVTGADRTLAVRWTSSGWRIRSTPNVGSDDLLRGITLPPRGLEFWVVGLHGTSGGAVETLVLRGY